MRDVMAQWDQHDVEMILETIVDTQAALKMKYAFKEHHNPKCSCHILSHFSSSKGS
jgi:hypothetical protein